MLLKGAKIMDIREAIHQRLKNSNVTEIQHILNDSIHSPDEAVLPGLGVLFEDYYLSLDQNSQQNICQTLSSLLK